MGINIFGCEQGHFEAVIGPKLDNFIWQTCRIGESDCAHAGIIGPKSKMFTGIIKKTSKLNINKLKFRKKTI
mgnify:CR=1 FL=1